MQIKELTLPANQKKITYEISKSGKTHIYTTSPNNRKKTYLFQNHLSKIHLGQLNSIQMIQGNQLQNILEENPFQAAKKKHSQKQQKQKQVCCSCKKSKCLKMYCECFARKLFCTQECSCQNCTNTQINSRKLLFLREEMMTKREEPGKGCKCQKSGCNKKYCECFSREQKCGVQCECLNCQNFEQVEIKPRKQKT